MSCVLLSLLPDANKLAVRPAVRTVSAVRERRETQPGTETEDQQRGENTAGGSQSLDHLSPQWLRQKIVRLFLFSLQSTR